MIRFVHFKSALVGGVSLAALSTCAWAADFDIPAGDLKAALKAYAVQSGVALIASDEAVRGARSAGAKGELTADIALARILDGTGFAPYRTSSGAVVVAKKAPQTREAELAQTTPVRVAEAATASSSGIESVVVTSSKIKGDIQTVPIAITALSQEQLTSRQIAGGPDLVKEVPNLTFSKTNFSGYNIEIRGIGTQAISVTTDPAVAVAFNDIPFIRNHFFEQEFYDVGQVEVLRGPQGTLYGRNATAGVVNVVSAKPTDQFEAMASADFGNYHNRRFEGMINIPITDDRLDLRVAAEWTKRDGYTFDSTLNAPIDGRDLWSGRVTLGWKPVESVQIYAIWEHFSENDDRLRSAKTLCHTDPGPSSIDGPDGLVTNIDVAGRAWLSQGCLPGSLYTPSAFGIPNPGAIPFIATAEYLFYTMPAGFNPYGTESQSQNLRVIGSPLEPHYQAKNDTVEFNANYTITPSLTLTSQTGYNRDFLYSTEDYNRFNTVPGAFNIAGSGGAGQSVPVGTDGQFCDPQLGCSDRFVAEDVSQEHAEQFYQEVRLASNFTGPLNFSAGASYLRYTTLEDYYVFANVLTTLQDFKNGVLGYPAALHYAFDPAAADACTPALATPTSTKHSGNNFGLGCAYIDPNPLSQIDGQGHNYFRSENPYRLHSWAGFGEAYYQVAPDVKLTGGLRWTDDMKSFTEIPSWTLVVGQGYPVTGILDQQWREWTGRFVANWTPKLDFTDQSLFYGSYSRGYKGGGANPPGVTAIYGFYGELANSPTNFTHPLTFAPEFVDAFELGTKNTLLDGAMTLNGDVFYYKYQNYQISEIVDRTAVNLNFNATVRGAELESTWEPVAGLRFNFAGGYENATLANGSQAIDLMDRTAGHPGWMVVRPFVSQTSNCIVPTSVMNEMMSEWRANEGGDNSHSAGGDPSVNAVQFSANSDAKPYACLLPYSFGLDPGLFSGTPTGYDGSTAPNDGAGFDKNLSGNQLPNAPHFTASLSGEYTMPVSEDWAATLHSDFYWQSQSYARVFNDRPYDKLRGYSTTNLALILTSADGWQVMGYLKNVFNVTAITGSFLNSDDTALTTNVFLTDPRLFGVRVTKNL